MPHDTSDIEQDVSDIMRDAERILQEKLNKADSVNKAHSASEEALDRFRREYVRRVAIHTAARA